MSIQVFVFTRGGVAIADGAIAAQRAFEFARSGEATAIVIEKSNGAAPAVDVILNGKSIGGLSASITAGDVSDAIKTLFASALSAIAGIGATPFTLFWRKHETRHK